MKTVTFLTLFAGLATYYVAAVPAPAPDTTFPDGMVVKYYPKGLPPGLYPGHGLQSRAPSLEKRDDPYFIDLSNQLSSAPIVKACRDVNFAGPCVSIKSRPGQCVDPPPSAPDANDSTSSVGPNRGWQCRFYVDVRCDESSAHFDIQYPGISDLTLTKFNDKISSYRCTKAT